MKKLAVLACALGALTVCGQTNSTSNLLESTRMQAGRSAAALGQAPNPNQIVRGNVIYSGLAVQVMKAHNPIQLLNPAAPPQYGSALDNLDRDPTSVRAFGLKIFSIRF